MKNIELMSLDEMVAEVKRLQGEMLTLTERISMVYSAMAHKARGLTPLPRLLEHPKRWEALLGWGRWG
jgi:hypothetical protein